MSRMRWGLAAAVCAAFSAIAAVPAGAANPVEVIAELGPPPLARAVASSRVLKPTARLDLAAPLSNGYRADLAQAQARVAQRIRAAIPGAEVRWRYTVTLDGLAVVLPARDVARLRRIPGVVRVDGNSRFVAQDTANVTAVKAPLIWGPDLATAGQGVKIGIIDDGIDQSHPYFSAQGFVAPAGYPRGQKTYTTGKVIVARSFWPPSLKTAAAREPFETGLSAHGTHVAGIAAGDYATRTPGGVSLSGIAPRAFLGNYKVYSRPDLGDGLNGNAPEVVAGIEAAVTDGMDVINLSLGEVEIDPRRDVVARALDAGDDVAARVDLDLAERKVDHVSRPRRRLDAGDDLGRVSVQPVPEVGTRVDLVVAEVGARGDARERDAAGRARPVVARRDAGDVRPCAERPVSNGSRAAAV